MCGSSCVALRQLDLAAHVPGPAEAVEEEAHADRGRQRDDDGRCKLALREAAEVEQGLVRPCIADGVASQEADRHTACHQQVAPGAGRPEDFLVAADQQPAHVDEEPADQPDGQ
jgi:hypothetical protein